MSLSSTVVLIGKISIK